MILFPSDKQGEYLAAEDGSNVDMTSYHRHREKAMIGLRYPLTIWFRICILGKKKTFQVEGP